MAGDTPGKLELLKGKEWSKDAVFSWYTAKDFFFAGGIDFGLVGFLLGTAEGAEQFPGNADGAEIAFTLAGGNLKAEKFAVCSCPVPTL